MKLNRKTVTTLLMVALVALAGIGAFAGSGVAATTTLAGDGTDEVTGFTANESNDLEYSINADDGTNGFDGDGTTTLFMNVTYDGEEYAVTEEAVSDGTATSQAVNISNDELSDLPGDAGESVNVTVNAWGTDGNGTETTTGSTFDVTITFDNSHAVTEVDDSSATIEEQDSGFFSMDTVTFWSSSSDDTSDIHTYEQTVGVDGSNTTVTVSDQTSNGSDAFDSAMEDKSSGDLIYGASAAVDGSPVLAFYQSADSDMVDENSTYAVYDANGNGEWTFELGDDYADASSVDVFVSSQSYTDVSDFSDEDRTDLFMEQADMNLRDTISAFGLTSLGAFNLTSFMPLAIGGLSMAVLIPVGRRRLTA